MFLRASLRGDLADLELAEPDSGAAVVLEGEVAGCFFVEVFGFGEFAFGEAGFPIVGGHVGVDDLNAIVPEFDFGALHEDADGIPFAGLFDGGFFGGIDTVEGSGALGESEAGTVDRFPAVGVIDDLDFESTVGGVGCNFFDPKEYAAVAGLGDFPFSGEFKVAVFLFGDEVFIVLAVAEDTAVTDFPGWWDYVQLIATPGVEGCDVGPCWFIFGGEITGDKEGDGGEEFPVRFHGWM